MAKENQGQVHTGLWLCQFALNKVLDVGTVINFFVKGLNLCRLHLGMEMLYFCTNAHAWGQNPCFNVIVDQMCVSSGQYRPWSGGRVEGCV
jgi:hypothetical protein